MLSPLTASHSSLLQAFEASVKSGATAQQLSDALGDENAAVIGYWQQDQLIGYAVVARLPFDAELQAIGVSPTHRQQGIGGVLLRAVMACANEWGSERMLLEVRAGNACAIQLYQGHGFAIDGRRLRYYPGVGTAEREDAMLMSRLC